MRRPRSSHLSPRAAAVLAVLALLLLTAAAASAQRVGHHVVAPDPAAESARAAAAAAAPHVAERYGVAPLAELGAAAVEAPERLAQLDAWNEAHRQPLRNGFTRPLPAPRRVDLAVDPASGPVTPASPAPQIVERGGGVLAPTTFTTVAWGGRVHVGGAYRLRLHLAGVELPAGARLWVHGGGQTAGPFGAELIAPDGGLWTPSVGGEELALDVEAPAAALAGGERFGFTIDRLLEMVAAAGGPATADAAKDTSCEVDASCFGSADFPGYDAARHAVARLLFIDDSGFGAQCTGQLLNDAASDGIPYLLTANHCVPSQGVAATLEALFDDYTTTCNGPPPAFGTLAMVNGATLLATGDQPSASDYALLRLANLPSGRTLLGWDAAPHAAPDGTRIYRISHPGGDPQKFSVTTAESRPARCAADLPPSRYIYSDITFGAAAPGSSGGAALLANGVVVGQLYGICGDSFNPCGEQSQLVDGAFAASFVHLQPFLAPGAGAACNPGDLALCLVGKRFQVQVTWVNQFAGTAGVAHAVTGTDEAGYFYFTEPSNYELIVKILDFGTVFKVFYGELTDLQFTITVADTQTGRLKTYTNTPGDCGAVDETAFPAGATGPAAATAAAPTAAGLPALAVPRSAAGGMAVSFAKAEERLAGQLTPAIPGMLVLPALPAETAETAGAAATRAAAGPAAGEEPWGGCARGGGTLCLLGGRFVVSVQWMNQFSGAAGAGRAQALSDLSGLFTFTDASDVELVLKVVPFTDRVAFYYAALSDLEYDITVTDLFAGAVKTYHNPAGSYCGGLDNDAFAPSSLF